LNINWNTLFFSDCLVKDLSKSNWRENKRVEKSLKQPIVTKLTVVFTAE
jgi:hypothetical protein